jgi:acyl carrier protein phosphodiesterase
MNYLGHAFLSFKHPEILAGNMIGDYVKGLKALEHFPPGIKKGIMLHRKIDSFTDQHPALLRAKNYFRQDYRLYAGAFVDIINDHFLANDPRYFSGEKALLAFSQEVYQTLINYEAFFPEAFRKFFPFMQQENWLYRSRTVKGIGISMNGLKRRAHFVDDTAAGYATFISHYYALNQCYYELIDDLAKFAKNELI